MIFHPGLDVTIHTEPLEFAYGPGIVGPEPELRALGAIRRSLRDPAADGPDPVYAIAMDVGKAAHRPELERRQLLYGVVAYARGRLADEPIRSQGHIHRISRHSGWRPPELYEVWRGKAVVYMQEFGAEDPGRCFAIEAGPGETVVVPPGWVHATISADPDQPLVFGAWCDRDFGFEYEAVRARGGIAWYPLLTAEGPLEWRPNPRYRTTALEVRGPRNYLDLGIAEGVPIYSLFERDPEAVQWVSVPARTAAVWKEFSP